MNLKNIIQRKIFGREKDRNRNVAGMLDVCNSSFVSGWCCSPDKTPSCANLFINNKHALRIKPTVLREDLIAHGFDAKSGFAAILPSPLRLEDEVRVCSDDGHELINSTRNYHRERLSRLMTGINPGAMVGLEMGPLDRPILSKKHGEVMYVDHASGVDLRRKYEGTPEPLIYFDKIVDIDYVWADGELSDVIGDGVKFDYCLSSHVMEHVPNPIWWLKSISGIIKSGGVVALVLPEQSKSFDYRRTATSPSDLIEAYVLDLRRPSTKQIFDHLAFASLYHLKDQNLPLYDTEKLNSALATAKKVYEDGRYFDVHCNVFSVDSFKKCWDVINKLDLVPLTLEAVSAPYPPFYDEFVVTFKRH